MKIKQLIKKLQKLDPELEVIISSDAEGNCFNYLEDIDVETGDEVELQNSEVVKDCIILFPR